MIYLFAVSIIYTLIKNKDQLLSAKRNLFLFLFLSIIGLALGIVIILNPYFPTIAMLLEKYMK